MKEKLLENKKVIIALIVFLLLSVIGLTVAYFVGQIGPAATTNVNLTTRTVDNLTFTTGNDITIGPVNQANFAQGSGNKSGSTTAKATLKANTGNNSATNTYNVYLRINSNTFQYTTVNNTAELVLKVTNPAGDSQTISGLTSVTSGGITGYDITTKKGIIPIATDYTITTTSTKTDTWTAQVYFINLNSDQQVNSAKTFNAELVIEKREPITVTFNANGGSVSQTSKEVTYGTNYGTLPTPTKSGATFLGWNGKNLAYLTNDSNLIGTNHSTSTNIDLDTGTISGINNLSGNNFIGASVSNLELNETYYVSWSDVTNILTMYAYDDRLWGNYLFSKSINPFSFTATTEKFILGFYVRPQILGTVSHFQLEKGNVATTYEPYYITSDVAVTQESNHTLTAIWG